MRTIFTFLLASVIFHHQAVGAQDAPSPLGDASVPIGPAKTSTTPVAWSYVSLQAGVDMFERSAAQMAPGAKMRYKMPKGMLPAKDDEATTAVIASKTWSVSLPLAADLSFVLPRNQKAKADGAYIVVSRKFPSGHYQHPIVEVRTPGLPDNVLRLGDLRLACEVQVRILKKDMLRARLLLDAMSLFGKSPCESDTGKIFDAPALHNSITYTAGKRKEVKLVTGKELEFNAPLGDDKWPDSTLITFALDGEPAPAPPKPKVADTPKAAKPKVVAKPLPAPKPATPPAPDAATTAEAATTTPAGAAPAADVDAPANPSSAPAADTTTTMPASTPTLTATPATPQDVTPTETQPAVPATTPALPENKPSSPTTDPATPAVTPVTPVTPTVDPNQPTSKPATSQPETAPVQVDDAANVQPNQQDTGETAKPASKPDHDTLRDSLY